MKKKIPTHIDKPEHTLFYAGSTEDVDRLISIYKEDKAKAKVIYCQNKSLYVTHRVVLFEWANGDFKICSLTRTYGISKTNIIYSREKQTTAIIYSKKKFYFSINRAIRQLSYNELIQPYVGGDRNNNPIISYFLNKFGWFRFYHETPQFHSIYFNTILSKKLYTYNSVLRHKYNAPLPAIKVILANKSESELVHFNKIWGEMRKNLTNIENLTPNLLKNEYLVDSSKMAEALGKKINCAWSDKRLKLQHDKWAKEITETILEFEPLRDLYPAKIFVEFEKFTGYEVLKTNHDLIHEGKKMCHCVGTYSQNVSSGFSGIYSINGYTLEARYDRPYYGDNKELADRLGVEKILIIGQYRGFSNIEAPTEHMEFVRNKIIEFNCFYFNKDRLNESLMDLELDFQNRPLDLELNDLPF